jgi:hypothetical protein
MNSQKMAPLKVLSTEEVCDRYQMSRFSLYVKLKSASSRLQPESVRIDAFGTYECWRITIQKCSNWQPKAGILHWLPPESSGIKNGIKTDTPLSIPRYTALFD